MSNQRRATLYALVTVLLWSTVATAFKLSLRHLEPVQLLLYANIASIAVLAAVLAAQRRLWSAFCVTRSQALRSLGLGLLNPFLYYLVLFEAYDRLPAQEAQPLNYTWAITLTLLSIPLRGHKVSARDLAAILVSYGGVVVISTRGAPQSLRFSDGPGVALALGSTILWALYWILNARDEREPTAAVFLNFVLALPFVLIACTLFSTPVVTDPLGLLGAAYVGCFEMGVTFVLWLWALRLADNTARIGNLIFLSPLVSLLLISWLVGERILPSTYVGLVLILAGLLVQRSAKREPSRADA